MRSRKLGLALAGVALSLSTFAVQAADQKSRPNVKFGKPISEADLVLWNIDIHTPTGGNLPPGEGTVAAGKAVYDAKCLACHGEAAAGGPMYGTMVGGIGTMDKSPRVLTPGSMYPYAPILFDYVRRSMPLDQPQSLTPDEVYSVAAYIYHLNGLVPEDFKMNRATMPTIKMPNHGNFIVDDRPDVRARRCMTNCKPIGRVADAEPRSAGNANAGGRSGSGPGANDKRR